MSEQLKIAFIGIASWWLLLLPFDYTLFNWFFQSIRIPVFAGLKSIDDTLIFETDTYGTYLLFSLSLILGLLSGGLIKWTCKKLRIEPTDLLKSLLAGILFLFLFKYGWDKITKSQFYQPEPNTLYTPFGNLSKDIAYWSLVGSSYSYTFVLGFIEVLAALLLVFKRTQFLASLLAIAIFGQIVLVNFSFDISVKLLSGSLLLFSLIYTACFPQNWRAIFGLPNTSSFIPNSRTHRIIKTSVVFLLVLESVIPSMLSGNFNDDKIPRLEHHGAYRVYDNHQVKYLFIHREYYLILQSWEDEFKDYRIDTRRSSQYTTLDGNISCEWTKNRLIISKDTFHLEKMPFRKMPLLQENFHPFSDEFH